MKLSLYIMIQFSALFMAESKFVKSSMLILNKTSDPSHKKFFGTFSDHAGITSACEQTCRAHASSSACFQKSKLKNTDTRNEFVQFNISSTKWHICIQYFILMASWVR